MTVWMTDKKLAEMPALAALDEGGRDEALADAGRVYRYVGRQGGLIEEDDLRGYGERNELPPDRLNLALGVLREIGLLHTMQDAGPIPPPGDQTAATEPTPDVTDGP